MRIIGNNAIYKTDRTLLSIRQTVAILFYFNLYTAYKSEWLLGLQIIHTISTSPPPKINGMDSAWISVGSLQEKDNKAQAVTMWHLSGCS